MVRMGCLHFNSGWSFELHSCPDNQRVLLQPSDGYDVRRIWVVLALYERTSVGSRSPIASIINFGTYGYLCVGAA